MQATSFFADDVQLAVRPTGRSLAYGRGFLAVFGGAALFYSIGVLLMLQRVPNDLSTWETVLVVGLPVLFAAALASWVCDSRRSLCFDRDEGLLFDGTQPVLSLTEVAGVAVREDPGESDDYYVVDLVLKNGQSFPLRKDWWPLHTDRTACCTNARQIAEFLGVRMLPQ